MRKGVLRRVLPLMACAVVLASPALGNAQGEVGAAFYGVDVNASLGFAVPNTDEFGSSLYLRGGAAYEVNSYLTLGLGLGWFSSEVDNKLETPPPNTIADGDLKVIPLTLDMQLRHHLPTLFGTLYAEAGIGYYFIDYSWSRDAKEYFTAVEATYGLPAMQDVNSSFGFNLGAGFEYPLTAQFFVSIEGNYLFLSPEAEGSWRDLVTGELHTLTQDVDLNTWLFSLGAKYLF